MQLQEALLHLRQEPNIARVIQQIELPEIKPSGRIYFDLLESIVSQQLSVKAAKVIFNRFLLLFEDQYPHPDVLSIIETDTLRSCGLSAQKAGYLKNVATFTLEHHLDRYNWHEMDDDAIIELLTRIKGVGKWTVQMLLIFTLGRPDVFPVDDLGIQQGMQRLFNIATTQPSELKKQMMLYAQPWQPYRSIASLYIWRYKDNPPIQEQ